jgi:molybdopterin molybdotransferase
MSETRFLQTTCPVAAAIDQVAQKLTSIASEIISIDQAAGRILGEDIIADRDSPASNVSAMDGFALRHSDYLSGQSMPICGQCSAGKAAITLLPKQVAKIFTGAPLPLEADTVIEREAATHNEDGSITFDVAALQKGRHVRHQGENMRRGDIAIQSRTALTAQAFASAVTFAPAFIESLALVS